MLLGDSVKDEMVRGEKRIRRGWLSGLKGGEDLTGKQVVSIEGDCGIHNSGLFLGCSFTWGRKEGVG